MPLRALIDNEEIISVDLTDEQWDELRKNIKRTKEPVILPCCNNHGYLRKSKLGLKHFSHSKSDFNCERNRSNARGTIVTGKQIGRASCRERV